MADFFSISATATRRRQRRRRRQVKYVPVDPDQLHRHLEGSVFDRREIFVPDLRVQGFRAKVKYQSDKGPIQFQDVLIKDNSFRIGNSKFLMKKIGHAQIKTVVTNPATGSTVLNTAYADRV